MTEETTPQRVRRMGREYASKFWSRQNQSIRKGIAFAWERGHWAALHDIAVESRTIDDAIAEWERDGDAEKLVAVLDEWLDQIEARVSTGSAA